MGDEKLIDPHLQPGFVVTNLWRGSGLSLLPGDAAGSLKLELLVPNHVSALKTENADWSVDVSKWVWGNGAAAGEGATPRPYSFIFSPKEI